jgi:hypothetical protein
MVEAALDLGREAPGRCCMSRRWLWLIILGLALLLIAAPLSLGQAGKAEKKAALAAANKVEVLRGPKS